MGNKVKSGKNRRDRFYQLAKEQGYRSRASFKLVQLNRRFDVLSSAARGVLDLCAAPGGWLQVARRYLPLGAPCIGVDIVPIRSIASVTTIADDITKDSCRSAVRKALLAHYAQSTHSDVAPGAAESVDLVLHDGSPNMGTAWLQDAYTQAELTLASLKLATEFLAVNGSFVTKVFRSAEYHSLLYVMHQLFRQVHATKPSASRAESAEIYVVCRGYKAPRRVDPRLVDPKTVFKNLHVNLAGGAGDESAAVSADAPGSSGRALLKATTGRKRANREGYEDNVGVSLFTRRSAAEFIQSERPLRVLVGANVLSFDAEHAAVEDREFLRRLVDLADTTEDVRLACEDLKVLGRSDFKKLLRWRMRARKALGVRSGVDASAAAEDGAATDGEAAADSGEENEHEMERIREQLVAKEKRVRRRSARQQMRAQRKLDLQMVIPGDNHDVGNHSGLFEGLEGRRRGDVSALGDGGGDGDSEPDSELEEEAKEARDRDGTAQEGGEEGEDEDAEAYLGQLEDEMNVMYDEYLSRRNWKAKQVLAQDESGFAPETPKRKGKSGPSLSGGAMHGDESDDEEEFEEAPAVGDSSDDDDSDSASSSSGDSARHAVQENGRPPSLSGLGDATDAELSTQIWFDQPLFQKLFTSAKDSNGRAVGPALALKASVQSKENAKSARPRVNKSISSRSAVPAAAVDDGRQRAEEFGDGAVNGNEAAGDGADAGNEELDEHAAEEENGFSMEAYDEDSRADVLAGAAKYKLMSKRGRDDLVDSSYHRYAFDEDSSALPRWFRDEDVRFRRRIKPATKQEVEDMKARVRLLEGRPTKKELEARGRKRIRAERRMERLRSRANAIAEDGGGGGRAGADGGGDTSGVAARLRAVEALIKKNSKRRRLDKQYVVASGGGGRKIVGGDRRRGAKVTYVDRRMKSDKRGLNKKKGKKGRGSRA